MLGGLVSTPQAVRVREGPESSAVRGSQRPDVPLPSDAQASPSDWCERSRGAPGLEGWSWDWGFLGQPATGPQGQRCQRQTSLPLPILALHKSPRIKVPGKVTGFPTKATEVTFSPRRGNRVKREFELL